MMVAGPGDPTFVAAAASLDCHDFLGGGIDTQEPCPSTSPPSPEEVLSTARESQSHGGKHAKKKPSSKIQKFLGNLVELAVSTLSSVASVSTSGTSLESDRATRRGDSSDLLTDCPQSFEQAALSCSTGALPICRVQIGVGSEGQLPRTTKEDWSAIPHESSGGHGEAKAGAGHAADAGDQCGQDMHSMHSAIGEDVHSASAPRDGEAELLPVLYFAMNYYALISLPVEAAGQLQLSGNGGPDAQAQQQAEQEEQAQEQRPADEGVDKQLQPTPAPPAAASAPAVSRFDAASKHHRAAPESAVSGFFFHPLASLAEVLETLPLEEEEQQQHAPGMGRAASALTTASSAASSTMFPAMQAARHGCEPAFMRESVSLEELLTPPRPREEACWRAPSGGLPAAYEPAFGRTSFPAAAAFPSAWPSP